MASIPEKWIAVEMGWGAQQHETALGPNAISKALSLHYDVKIQPEISFQSVPYLSYAESVVEVENVANQLIPVIQNTLRNGEFPIVIGGDESIGIGTWSGAVIQQQAQQKFGLIWFDAHADAHTPQTSPSIAIHGMPIAILLGAGEKSLVNLGGIGQKLDPQHVVLIGTRSYEPEEAEFIKNNNITVYDMNALKKHDLLTIVKETVQYFEKNCVAFGVNIDLDVFDPSIVPGVGTPAPGGITDPASFSAVMQYLYQHPQFCALEISEYNPAFDNDNRSIHVIQQILDPWLHHKGKK